MHDQRKVRQSELDEKQKLFVKEKIDKFQSLYKTMFQLRDSGHMTCDPETLTQLIKLLEINPENYSMYAYRRRLLSAKWHGLQQCTDLASFPAAAADSSSGAPTAVTGAGEAVGQQEASQPQRQR